MYLSSVFEIVISLAFRILMAEGARFELAVHEVDAGFQDRWFQPLTHPSEKIRVGRTNGE
jgi:hypothetical protein